MTIENREQSLTLPGYMKTKALVAAVELNIPDILASGSRTVDELAAASSARPDRLKQVMNTLKNNGIFSYDAEKGMYHNNTTSELLARGHWTQWCNWVDLYGNEFYDMARGLPASLKSNRCPAQINYDTDESMFNYFTKQGWMPKFLTTLSGGANAQAPGILADYPWDEVADATVLDIGGGDGGLIALLLRRYVAMKGGVMDLSKSIELCKNNFWGPEGKYTDVGSRVAEEHLITGDFLKGCPAFEVYTMKWCLHDWADSEVLVILKNIRRSIKKGPRSRLIILESILRDGHMGRMSRYGDLNMMIAVGGGERTEQQWLSLAAQSGWQVGRVCVLRNAWPCAIEFLPDWDYRCTGDLNSGVGGNKSE